MRRIKKVITTILSILAVIGTYIGFNQFTNRDGDSYTPPSRKPPVRTQGGATRNTEQPINTENKVQ